MNKNLLLKITAIEFVIVFLLSACLLDSRTGTPFFIFGIVVSSLWLFLFTIVNERKEYGKGDE